MTELRSRHTTKLTEEEEKVTPLDSNEQDRIIKEFELDKLKQDRLWKHFLSILYGCTCCVLLLVLCCSLLFGCGPRSTSPLLNGPRCTYFALPTHLYETIADIESPTTNELGSTPFNTLLVNTMLIFSLIFVVSWGYYAWAMNEVNMRQEFNQSRQTKKSSTNASDESKESEERAFLAQSSTSTSSPITLPIPPSEWHHLLLIQRIVTVELLLWILMTVALIVLRSRSIGFITGFYLVVPTFLACLTKLAAKWGHDLEDQISDLKSSKYSYHDL